MDAARKQRTADRVLQLKQPPAPARSSIEGLRCELATLRNETDTRFAALSAIIAEQQLRIAELRLRIEPPPDDSEDDPDRKTGPADWGVIKAVAAEKGYSESGLRAMIKRDIGVVWRMSGGRVWVDATTVKVRKNVMRTFLPRA
jgi:hypothetical protein